MCCGGGLGTGTIIERAEVTDTRRAARLRARREAADRQLRRPRLVARGQRRRLRGAARRPRHQRDADGAVPVGTRRRPRCTAARTSACTSRSTPSGTPTGGVRSPTRRACSTATAASRARSRTSGTTPTSTRCARSAGPRSSGRSSGASTSRHLDSHMGTLQLRPEFFDVYLELAVDFGLPLRMAGASAERARSASRSGGSPPRKASSSPTTSCTRSVGSRRAIERALFDLAARRHRGLPAPGGRHRRAAGVAPRLGEPRRGPRHAVPATPRSRDLVERAGVDARSATASCATAPARRLTRRPLASTRRRASRSSAWRAWYSGELVSGSSCMSLPMLPATFIRPCMNAALASSSPFCDLHRVVVARASA